MTETLLRAYIPLLLWPGLGLLLFRFLPQSFPRLLGRLLYWVGVPLEILSLARRAELSGGVGLTPIFVVAALAGGLLAAEAGWSSLKWFQAQRRTEPAAGHSSDDRPDSSPTELLKTVSKDFPKFPKDAAEQSAQPTESSQSSQSNQTIPKAEKPSSQTLDMASQGSFVLSSMIGNTGFVGLAIAPTLISDRYLSWVVFYSIAHNIIGTYGVGVFCASYFGRSATQNHWWFQLRDVLTVPSLWAFILGISTRSVALPSAVETGLEASVWIVIPCALLLMGMRLSQVQGWSSVRLAVMPVLIKVFLLPLGIGLGATWAGITADPRLALVLMSGMPCAFANLILAEEYNLNRDLVASSVALSSLLLLGSIPVWLLVFPPSPG